MSRTRSACALLACLPFALPAAGAAAAPAKRCKALGGPYEISTAKVKVVRRRTGAGLDRLRGCARPNGRVRVLATAQDMGLGDSSVDAGEARGTWVSLSSSGNNQYGGGTGTSLVDVRTGRGYGVFSASYMLGDPFPSASLDRLLFDSRGRAATAIGTPSGLETRDEAITVHAPDGTAIEVDRGPSGELPAESLTFAGAVVSWTRGGVHRSVTFR